MSEFNIEVAGGSSVRLTTAGKYCDRDIVVTATGGGEQDHTVEDGLITGTLTEYTNDRVESVRPSAFSTMTALEKVELQSCSIITSSVFNTCSNLKEVYLPSLKRTKSSSDALIFRSCISLPEISLPSYEGYIVSDMFRYCTALQKANVGAAISINSNAFGNCTNLKVLILRKKDAVCTLSGMNAFTSTPFASGGTGGTVYVPAALITEYQNATNWSTLYAAGTCNFVAIEGSEYE